MNPTAYDLALIAGGFGIVGALLGAWVTYRLAIKLVQRTHENAIALMQRQDFNKAASIFGAAFLPETTFLKRNANIGNLGSSDDLGELLRFACIHRHLKALEVFKGYLCPEQQRDIETAWQEYCYHPQKVGELYFEQYSHKSTDRENKSVELKQLALQRIERILEFGKHK